MKDKAKLIISMLAFGTVGLFVKGINMPSSIIALVRGGIATLFLFVFSRLRKSPLDTAAIKKNIAPLLISGCCIGFNWILLFEAYRYTTVAVATLCYYLAPVFVILVSPLILKERLTLRKGICVFTALLGMVFVSGVADSGGISGIRGILFGTGAAVLYACVMLINKKMPDIGGFDRTLVQLGSATAALLPYVLTTEWGNKLDLSAKGVVLLVILGVFHTGICYAMYFSSLKDLPAQTSAILSYIDPVSAIILSAILLNEKMTVFGIIGAVLLLGAMLCSELSFRKNTKNKTKRML